MAEPAARRTRQFNVASRVRFSSRRANNPDATMSIVEHIQELRRRVIISVIALLIGGILGFIWYGNSLPGVPALGDILRGPYCSLPPERRAAFTADGSCRLLATSPFEMLKLRMKVGLLAGSVLSSPVWLYQIWAFITPGLHRTERRWTLSFVSIAVLLFVGGAALAYLCVAYGLEFLMGIGEKFQTAALTGADYFSFLLGLLLIFGISFEVPLVLVMGNLLGILRYETIRGKRSYVVVGLSVFAAAITPGQDPFSMIILLTALVILVEAAFQFCRINDKRRADSRPEWLGLDDDTASTLDTAEGGTDRPQKIAKPEPIRASQRVQASPKPSEAQQRASSHGPSANFRYGSDTDFSDVL